MDVVMDRVEGAAEALGASTTALLVAVVAGAITLCFMRNRRRRARWRKRGRAMSFASSVMVAGSFPKEANVPAPIINGLVYTDRALSVDEASDALSGFFAYRRFAQVPEYDAEHKEWTFVPVREGVTNDARRHVREEVVDGEAALHAAVARVMDAPLTVAGEGRPLWEAVIYRNAHGGAGQRSALLVRLHHVIGDGIGLTSVVLDVFRDAKGKRLPRKLPFKPRAPPPTPSCGVRARRFCSQLVKSLTLASSTHDAALPPLIPDAEGRASLAYSKRALALLPDVPLAVIKELKNAAGSTVNDVLMTLVAGALRRYVLRHDESGVPSGVQVRALMPLALPRPMPPPEEGAPEGHNDSLRNLWCFVSVDTGVGVEDPVDRCRHIREGTTELKAGPMAAIQMGFQSAVLQHLPLSLLQSTAHDIFARHSVVFSNVPGPTAPVYVGDTGVAVVVVFPNLLPQVGLLSYHGTVHGCLVVPDPEGDAAEGIADGYAQELRALAEALDVDLPAGVADAAR